MYDLGQTVLFYFIFKYKGIHTALISAMIMTLGSLTWNFLQKKEISKVQLFSAIIITFSVVFSILFKNPSIFQYKTSVMYAIFGIVIFIWPVLKKKTVIELLTQQHNFSSVPNISYKNLNNLLGLIFISASVINLYIIRTRTLEEWVVFKMKLAFWMTLLIVGLLGYSFYAVKKKDKSKDIST